MLSLNVEIDRAAGIALFSGEGTFHAKDVIKTLGRARWEPGDKCWKVSDFTLSDEELESILGKFDVYISVKSDVSGGNVQSDASDKSGAFTPITTGIGQANPSEGSVKIPEGYSVRGILSVVKKTLSDKFSEEIYVYGVLSSVKRYGGRVYLSLSDAEKQDESIDCVIWSGDDVICKELYAAGFKLEKDLQVMFAVRVGLNQKRGSISLGVTRVVAEYTVIKLAAKREITNRTLKKEGLFDKNRQRRFPFLPGKLGILTSSGGTVIHDFRNSLDVAEFGFKLYWYPISVQGDVAKSSIIQGLKILEKNEHLDAILLFRGGGSAAELSVFNDYEVAKAVCNCKLPVFSAIGHQEDQSSVQDVSYKSFGVPKDLGRFFADIITNLRDRVDGATEFVHLSVSNIMGRTEERLRMLGSLLLNVGRQCAAVKETFLENIIGRLPLMVGRRLQDTENLLFSTVKPLGSLARVVSSQSEQRLQLSGNTIRELASRIWEDKERTLFYKSDGIWHQVITFIQSEDAAISSFEKHILSASPEVQLKRGFVMVSSLESGEYVKKADGLTEGDRVSLQFIDGKHIAAILDG